MAMKRGLGKGLDALLGDIQPVQGEQRQSEEVEIRLLDPNPDQPRKEFDQERLAELAASVRRHGVVQPILVTKQGERYTIVAGERRFRAAKMAGLQRVPVLVRELDSAALMEISLIENIQRENLNPVEEAAAMRFLMEQHDLTQEELAARLGKSRPAIANALRLLNLSEPVRELVRNGELSAGHGRALAALSDEKEQKRLADAAVLEGWSVREMEKQAKRKPAKPVKEKTDKRDSAMIAAEDQLRERLMTKVSIQGTTESGKIVIEYYSPEDLQRVYEIIAGVEETL